MLSEVYMHLEKMPAAICEYLRFLYDKRGAAGVPVAASGCVKRHLEKRRIQQIACSSPLGLIVHKVPGQQGRFYAFVCGYRSHSEHSALYFFQKDACSKPAEHTFALSVKAERWSKTWFNIGILEKARTAKRLFVR